MPSQNYFRRTLSKVEVCTANSWSSHLARIQERGHSDLQGLMQTNWNKWEHPAHSTYAPGLDSTVFHPPNYLADTPPLQHAYIIKLFPCPMDYKPEDKRNRLIWNIGICLRDYTVSQPTRSQPELIFNVSHCTSMVLHSPVLSSPCKRPPQSTEPV